MKTSTKIFVIYGSVLIALQLLFLGNSLIQYYQKRPLAVAMCRQLEETPIHHLEFDVSMAAYELDDRRWKGERDTGPWVKKSESYRRFYLGANLETCRISADTLYLKAVYDDFSWRPSYVPELLTSRVIEKERVVDKEY